MAFRRIIIGGKTGVGKSHLVLTAPKGVMCLYHDRVGGDDKLKGFDDLGVHVWQGNQAKPRDAFMAKIKQLRDGELQEKKIQTVVLDTITYLQKWQKDVVSGQSLRGMSLAKNGDVVADVRDMLNALFALPAHIVILTHIKPDPEKDAKGNILRMIWRHDIMPALYKDISREVSLLGYAWKGLPTAPGGPNTYGTCFIEENGNQVFADAKAPNGWGRRENSNIAAWFKRLDDEAEIERAASRAAIMAEPDWRIAPEPAAEAADKDLP